MKDADGVAARPAPESASVGSPGAGAAPRYPAEGLSRGPDGVSERAPGAVLEEREGLGVQGCRPGGPVAYAGATSGQLRASAA